MRRWDAANSTMKRPLISAKLTSNSPVLGGKSGEKEAVSCENAQKLPQTVGAVHTNTPYPLRGMNVSFKSFNLPLILG